MILTNLENLSENEIRYLAKDELENADSLTREQLIEKLKEIPFFSVQNNFSGTSVHKYINSISPDSEYSDSVQISDIRMLSEKYNETSIHIVRRNLNWAYAYWNLSNAITEMTEKEDISFKIVVNSYKPANMDIDAYSNYFDLSVPLTPTTKDKILNSYEIYVGNNDRDWNIQLPWENRRYTLTLFMETETQTTELCSSNAIECQNSELISNPGLLDKANIYTVLINSLLSKSGKLIKNTNLREILVPSEVRDEEQD